MDLETEHDRIIAAFECIDDVDAKIADLVSTITMLSHQVTKLEMEQASSISGAIRAERERIASILERAEITRPPTDERRHGPPDLGATLAAIAKEIRG